MPEFLLSLVTEFAGPFVDLLISGLGWKKDEQQKLKQLKKQLLETVANTIEYLTSTKISPARRHYITKQWNELAIDLEAYEHLRKRVEDFARATEDSDKWNNSQKLALAIRLNAFRASILKTNSSDLIKLGMLKKKRRPGTLKQPAPKETPLPKSSAQKARRKQKRESA